MGRNTEYQFVDTDTETLIAALISAYEQVTKTSVHPASPEKLFIQWVADVIVQERVINNYTANQNIPSRAEGENLDALGELFLRQARPEAQAAVCTERFYISEPQPSSVLIPAGTRVTDVGNTLIWETTTDVYIPIGSTFADAAIACQTAGVIGNGYAIGQISKLIDVYDYYDHCENITQSDDGADRASDQHFYELMRASQDAYSNAGAKGGYIYFAKQVSTEIADVVANSPGPGRVALYVLMKGGNIAGEEMKNAVLAACSPDEVRPLTDHVEVADPEVVPYDLDVTYYIASGAGLRSAEIEQAVQAAVHEFLVWQSAKLGRDINPSYLAGLLMQTGIKRLEIQSPKFTKLRDGSDHTVPQVAAKGTVSITNGGYEDE